MFKQKDEPKTAWMHPRSRHWHLIMRGANCWSDHQMLRSKVTFRIRQNTTGKGQVSRPSPTLQNYVPSYTGRVLSRRWIALSPNVGEKINSTPDEEWAALQQIVYNTAKTYLGKPDGNQVRPQPPRASDSF